LNPKPYLRGTGVISLEPICVDQVVVSLKDSCIILEGSRK